MSVRPVGFADAGGDGVIRTHGTVTRYPFPTVKVGGSKGEIGDFNLGVCGERLSAGKACQNNDGGECRANSARG